MKPLLTSWAGVGRVLLARARELGEYARRLSVTDPTWPSVDYQRRRAQGVYRLWQEETERRRPKPPTG